MEKGQRVRDRQTGIHTYTYMYAKSQFVKYIIKIILRNSFFIELILKTIHQFITTTKIYILNLIKIGPLVCEL